MSEFCRNCPICDLEPREQDSLGLFRTNHHNRAEMALQSYDLSSCACGDLIYLSPLPSESDIRAMYSETRQFGDENYQNPIYRGDRVALVMEYISGCLERMLHEIDLRPGTKPRVLEVGAGLAWMCRAAKAIETSSWTVAQDLSSETVGECHWVDRYLVEDLVTGSSVDPLGPFDVISLTHVIEHVTDPLAMLRRLRGLLSEEGLIFVTAPFRPSGWAKGVDRRVWEDWSYNHVPAHVQYFSKGSFARAATAAGLELCFWSDQHDHGQAFEGWLRHPA